MQTHQAPDGTTHREFVSGKAKDVQTYFDTRRAELEREGYKFLGREKVSKNAPCPCASGRKFKRCCVNQVVRIAGASFMVPYASATDSRKL